MAKGFISFVLSATQLFPVAAKSYMAKGASTTLPTPLGITFNTSLIPEITLLALFVILPLVRDV